MARLQNDPISSKITIQKVAYHDLWNLNFFLIYRNSITVGETITKAKNLESIAKSADMASLLQGAINRAFRETTSISWLQKI